MLGHLLDIAETLEEVGVAAAVEGHLETKLNQVLRSK